MYQVDILNNRIEKFHVKLAEILSFRVDFWYALKLIMNQLLYSWESFDGKPPTPL